MTGQFLEIACDESGSEGEKLVGGTTDVFAHASVHLSAESAASSVQEIRDRIRSPAMEYKANHLLREKHRSVLVWLLGRSGPIHGNARVYLAEKTFFAVGRVVDLLVGDGVDAANTGLSPGRDRKARAMAVALYREGPLAYGAEHWQAFLESSNDLMRAKDRADVRTPVDSFFRMVDVPFLADAQGNVDGIMAAFRRARPRADAFRAQLLDNPTMTPALDPLIPAIVRAVVYWGAGGKPVSIVHDEQYALTEERITQLKGIFDEPPPALPRNSPRARLTSLRLVDSRSDARVQLADFLAGVARKIASEELNNRGDPELTALLRPYADPLSVWGDERSGSVLVPFHEVALSGDLSPTSHRWPNGSTKPP